MSQNINAFHTFRLTSNLYNILPSTPRAKATRDRVSEMTKWEHVDLQQNNLRTELGQSKPSALGREPVTGVAQTCAHPLALHT